MLLLIIIKPRCLCTQQKYNNYFNFPLNFVIEIVRICIMKKISSSKSNKCKSEQNYSVVLDTVRYRAYLALFSNPAVAKSQPSGIIIYLAVPVLHCGTLCPLRYLVRHRKRMNKQTSPKSDSSSSSLIREYSFVLCIKQVRYM